MTTPAHTLTQTILGAGTISITQVRPYPSSFIGSFPAGAHAIGWVKDLRPASSSADRVGRFLKCHPWTRTAEDYRMQTSDVTMTVYGGPNNEQTWEFTGGSFWVSGITPPTPPDPSNNMVNWAMVKALNKIKDQHIHVGNFIAEFKKTANMVAGAATSIAKQVQRFQRRYPDLWSVVKRVQTGGLPRYKWCQIPGQWLALQYGWKPLMSDVKGAVEALYEEARQSDPICIAKGQVKDEVHDVVTANGSLPSIAEIHWGTERTVNVTLAYKVGDPHLAELSSLGLVNPAEIVWELTPYSFVVDWFLPIGPWLSALTGGVGTDFVSGTITAFSKQTFRGCAVRETSPNYTFHGAQVGPQYKGKWIVMNRTCLTSNPLPGLYVKNPMSALHAANAIALLYQVFRR